VPYPMKIATFISTSKLHPPPMFHPEDGNCSVLWNTRETSAYGTAKPEECVHMHILIYISYKRLPRLQNRSKVIVVMWWDKLQPTVTRLCVLCV
jgi:hypothetical protein